MLLAGVLSSRYFHSAGPAHWLWEVTLLSAASIPLLPAVQLYHTSHFPTSVPDGGSGNSLSLSEFNSKLVYFSDYSNAGSPVSSLP